MIDWSAHMSSKWLPLLFAATLVMASCNAPHSQSSPNGAIGVGLAPRPRVSPIKPRSLEVLATFKTHLTGNVGRQSMRPSAAANPRLILRQSLFSSLAHVGGIPRGQLKPVMGALVSPHNRDCGGASCSRVFALKSDEVDGFLDDSQDSVENHRTPKTKDEQDLKDLLLASLTPEEELRPKLTLEERLAALTVKETIPDARPTKVHDEGPAFSSLTQGEMTAIRGFTYKNYQGVRMVQTRTNDELIKLGVSKENIQVVRQLGESLEKTLAKLPKTPGLVYRGISGLTKKDWEDLFIYKERRSFVTLGQNNMPATTSATWSPHIATGYLYQKTDGLRVIFGIKQRSGVAIEKLSVYPYEKEVLLPASSLYQITDIAYFERKLDVLYVELVEVLRL